VGAVMRTVFAGGHFVFGIDGHFVHECVRGCERAAAVYGGR
jgi:hypothetical protein